MDASPQQLEANVRENLRKHFAQATTTAELIIAGQQLDAAVEQLANWRLGLSSADLDGPSFGAKIKQTWPNHHSELLRLHQRRNDFAHGTIYQDEAAISWANQYVGCVIRIWGDLFGRGSEPPTITPPHIVPHPVLNTAPPRTNYRPTTAPANVPPARQPASLSLSPPAPPAKAKKLTPRPTPWRLVPLAVLQGALAVWLIGLALGLINGSWAAALIAVAAALVAAGYGGRTLIRFAGAVGVGRLILILLVVVGAWWLFRLLLVPGDNPILAHGHDTAAPLLGLIGAFPSAAGAEPIPSQSATNGPVAPPGANATRVGAAAALTRQAVPLAPAGEHIEGAMPELQPESATELVVGRRARVVTAGNRLNGRSEPGLAGAIVAAFENGQLLDVIEGPVSADGYRWWRLRGEAGEGWSADEFLVAIE